MCVCVCVCVDKDRKQEQQSERQKEQCVRNLDKDSEMIEKKAHSKRPRTSGG